MNSINELNKFLERIDRESSNIECVDYRLKHATERKVISKYNFHREVIENRRIVNVDFKNCSFRGAFISFSQHDFCTFENCSFLLAAINDHVFSNCVFLNCAFLHLSLRRVIFKNCDFEHCYFTWESFEENSIINSSVLGSIDYNDICTSK